MITKQGHLIKFLGLRRVHLSYRDQERIGQAEISVR